MFGFGSWFGWRWLHVAALFLWLAPLPAPRAPVTVTASARAMQPGELVVLTITTTAPADRVQARAFDTELHPFKIDGLTWCVLVGIDLDVKPAMYPVTIAATSAGHIDHATHPLVVLAKTFPTRTLTVDDAFVNPPANVTARIDLEARALAVIWTSSAAVPLWTGPFVRPVAEPANSAFGTRSIYNGQPRSPHAGADFLSPSGTAIHAPNGGHVILARELYYTGNTVIIDHGLGLFSLFAHLSAINVRDGDTVKTGDTLGLVGATGRVTGPHLHWAIRLNGARIDPLSVLATMGTR